MRICDMVERKAAERGFNECVYTHVNLTAQSTFKSRRADSMKETQQNKLPLLSGICCLYPFFCHEIRRRARVIRMHE